jgi:hypothetical protein
VGQFFGGGCNEVSEEQSRGLFNDYKDGILAVFTVKITSN